MYSLLGIAITTIAGVLVSVVILRIAQLIIEFAFQTILNNLCDQFFDKLIDVVGVFY